MYYGCAWYPEHWPEERWPEDLRLMREAGMNVVRVAEFAWSRLEPAEGRYELDWLERAIEQAARVGLRTVVGTPTAAPPAWLTQRYPDVLAIRESGQPERHGSRCHYAAASPRYREFCRRIAAALAARFGSNPNVLGWQIDNEYWSWSFDPHTMARFHAWLRARYGTLENLNRAWSTAYWSQEYSDWSQIPAWHGSQNPCLQQAGKAFLTDVYGEYQAVQVEALRAAIEPRQWITHNAHAHENLDFCRIARDLDFVSWDPYLGGRRLDPVGVGPVLDFARGMLRRNVWVMETQPGSVNWDRVNSALHRGELRRLVWQCLGHGADAVLFWQWRSALGGQEQYHGSVVAPDGTPRPLYAEIAQAGAEIARAAPLLDGTRIETSVALLDRYADRWALRGQPHHADYDANRHLASFYAPLRAAGHDVDIAQPGDKLVGYRLVVAPHAHVLTPDMVDNLVSFVQGGGHLLLGPRSGFKDEHNALLPSRQPGDGLAAVLGARVAEYYALGQPVSVTGELGNGTASIWAEYLTPHADGVEVPLRYVKANGWLDGQPALVTRRAGAGRISYLGAWLDDVIMRRVTDWALRQAAVASPNPPEGLEVCRRTGEGRELLIAINHRSELCTLPLAGRWESVLTRQTVAGECVVAAGDVVVLAGPAPATRPSGG